MNPDHLRYLFRPLKFTVWLCFKVDHLCYWSSCRPFLGTHEHSLCTCELQKLKKKKEIKKQTGWDKETIRVIKTPHSTQNRARRRLIMNTLMQNFGICPYTASGKFLISHIYFLFLFAFCQQTFLFLLKSLLSLFIRKRV